MVDKNFDDTWELKDPHSGEVKDTISAKKLWQKICTMANGRKATISQYVTTLACNW